jgi:hypothetical protein
VKIQEDDGEISTWVVWSACEEEYNARQRLVHGQLLSLLRVSLMDGVGCDDRDGSVRSRIQHDLPGGPGEMIGALRGTPLHDRHSEQQGSEGRADSDHGGPMGGPDGGGMM